MGYKIGDPDDFVLNQIRHASEDVQDEFGVLIELLEEDPFPTPDNPAEIHQMKGLPIPAFTADFDNGWLSYEVEGDRVTLLDVLWLDPPNDF